jgi:dTDP-4-dehydrorhamnose reductase
LRTLLLGSRGQVGRELQRRIPAGTALTAFDKDELDICCAADVLESVRSLSPDLIINAAAYTAVDQAESDRDAAFAVNATGARNIAVAARAEGCRLVHISTDFIFDGKQGHPYESDDEARPLSTYGRSKLDGEEAVGAACGELAITVRTSWIYSRFGGNFVKTMLSLMEQRPRLAVVCDQVGCPTWAGSLAEALWELGGRHEISGIIHWTDAGVASWFDFAVAIQSLALELDLLETRIPIEPILTTAFPTPATRPTFSVLDTSEARRQLETVQPHWRDSLYRMLVDLKEEAHA